ncbi:MAG: hypothetical protein H6925_04620 [Holosporaceae bacterium]|nr:MAG: hypothetical protein H6925_04620 [Holosporaceae bacterium]
MYFGHGLRIIKPPTQHEIYENKGPHGHIPHPDITPIPACFSLAAPLALTFQGAHATTADALEEECPTLRKERHAHASSLLHKNMTSMLPPTIKLIHKAPSTPNYAGC